jgi:hypothetical protein
MRFSNIMLPSNADSVVLTVRLYSREAGGLRQNLQQPVQAAFALSHATTGSALATISLSALPVSGEFRQKMRVAFPVQTWRGQTVNLQPILANLDQNKSRGALLHVYEFNPANANKNGDQLVETVPANPRRLSCAFIPIHLILPPGFIFRFQSPERFHCAFMMSMAAWCGNGMMNSAALGSKRLFGMEMIKMAGH